MIKANPNPCACSLTQNPHAIITQLAHAPTHPYWNNTFLPVLVNKYEVNNAATTCTKFITIGKPNLSEGTS